MDTKELKLKLKIRDLKRELTSERAVYADQPEDRLYHASDNTWWRRTDGAGLCRQTRSQG
jgi:hypothetical protein